MDAADYWVFESCLGGPAVTQGSAGCLPALLDGDQDVDFADFAAIQVRYR